MTINIILTLQHRITLSLNGRVVSHDILFVISTKRNNVRNRGCMILRCTGPPPCISTLPLQIRKLCQARGLASAPWERSTAWRWRWSTVTSPGQCLPHCGIWPACTSLGGPALLTAHSAASVSAWDQHAKQLPCGFSQTVERELSQSSLYPSQLY